MNEKTRKEQALYRIAKIIQAMDTNILTMEDVSHLAVMEHRMARNILWKILYKEGYDLEPSTYKLIKRL